MSKRLWLQTLLVPCTLVATLSAALLAYGTDPFWGRFHRGMGLIVFTHRMQWLLAAASLLMCVAVVCAIVAAGFRTAWLFVLAPVLGLFVHRFIASPARAYAVVEDPICVKAAASALADADEVVGVQCGDTAYAYSFAALDAAPVVLQSSHEQRFILIWSPFANRALAYKIDREIKLRELQIVSMPANALLLYNGRDGQFINGVTGQTTRGEKPAGFRQPITTYKLTWSQWKKLHPATLVAQGTRPGPSLAMSPAYAMPDVAATRPARIIFAPATRPVAVPSDAIGPDPANISAGESQLLMFRDRQSGLLRVFERRVGEDLFPMFRRKSDPKRAAVTMEDMDSGTEWSADGKGIEGPFKGEQLKPVVVEDQLYWDVMKHWYPQLQWATPAHVTDGNLKNAADPKRRRR